MAALERWCRGRAHARQRHRRLALSAAGAGEGGEGQAPHRPRRHRPGRCADLLRRALRLARGGRADRAWMAAIQRPPISRSAELPPRRARFPLSTRSAIWPAPNVRALPEDVRAAIAPPRHPQRAARPRSRRPARSRCWPTTSRAASSRCSTSAMSAACWSRDGTRAGGGRGLRATRSSRRRFGADAPLAEAFVDAEELDPARHLEMQAALQRHVDSSISKTINCPRRHRLRGLQGRLPRRLCPGPQGLHHLSAECGDGLGARSEAVEAANVPALAPAAPRERRGLHRPAARPARGPSKTQL